MRKIILNESQLRLILEASIGIDGIYEKHYSKIPRGKFDEICQLDPTFNGNKLGNYCKWLLSLYMRGKLKDEDFYVVRDCVRAFNDYKARIEKKDINQYKSVDELLSAVGQFINSDAVKSKSDQIRRIKQGAEKAYEDDEWIIIVPRTKEASIYYGKGTKWCTASERPNDEFETHTEEGPLYILISKTRKDEEGRQLKFQFHFPTHQFKNSLDNDVHSDEIGLTDGVIKFFKERENKDARNLKSEKELWVEYNNRVNDALYTCEHDGRHPAEVWDTCTKLGNGYFCCCMEDDELRIEDPNKYIIKKDGHRVGKDYYQFVNNYSNGYFVVTFSSGLDSRHAYGNHNILNAETGEYLLDNDWYSLAEHFNELGLIIGNNNFGTYVLNSKGQMLNKKPFKDAFLNQSIDDDGVAFYGYYGNRPTCYDINGHEIHTKPYAVLQNSKYGYSGYVKVMRPCSLENVKKYHNKSIPMPYEFNVIVNGKLFSPKWWKQIDVYQDTRTAFAQGFNDECYILDSNGMPLPKP